MDGTTLRLVCGVLAVVICIVLVARRRSRKAE